MENNIIDTIKKVKTEYKINPPLFSLLDKMTYTYFTSNKEIEMDLMFNVSHFLKKNEVGIIQSKESCKRTFSKDEYLPVKVLPENIGDDNIENLFISYYTRRLEEITESFIPTLYNSVLYNIPEEGGSYYNSLGLLRNTFINTERLQKVEFNLVNINKGSIYSPLRNHYRAIQNPCEGLTLKDLRFFRDYLKNYISLAECDIMIFAGADIISQLREKIYSYTKSDNALIIEGVRIYSVDSDIPEGFMLVLAVDENKGKYDHNQSLFFKTTIQKSYVDGVGFETNMNLEDLLSDSLKDVSVQVPDVGVSLIGRERMLIVDTVLRSDSNKTSEYPLMSNKGLDKLQEYSNKCKNKLKQFGQKEK